MRTQISALLAEVLQADISNDLCRILTRLLYAMQHAIDEVQITGSNDIRASIEMVIGGVVVYWTETQHKDDIETSAIRKRR